MSVNEYNSETNTLQRMDGGGGKGGLELISITQAEYDELSEAEKNDPNKLYDITDAPAEDLTQYATKAIVGLLSDLSTTDKSNIIAAINELVTKLKGKVNNLKPNDHTLGLDYTYDANGAHLHMSVDGTDFEMAKKEDLNAACGIKHVETITDFNELVPSYWNTTQVFIVDYKGSESLKNTPNDDVTHYFVIVSRKSGEVTQIAYETHFNKMYMRLNTAATDESNWSPWVEMITSANMPHLYQHSITIQGDDKNGDGYWFYCAPFYTASETSLSTSNVDAASSSDEIRALEKVLDAIPNCAMGTDVDFDSFTSMSKYSHMLVGCHSSQGIDPPHTVVIWNNGNWNYLNTIGVYDIVKQIF